MSVQEQQYLDIMRKIRDEGEHREDRTGVGTRAIFGTQMRFDLSETFPLFTTKRVWFKGVVHELLWMLSGDTNIKYLVDNGVHIWDEWADEEGNLGPVYGQQWRKWDGGLYHQFHLHKAPLARTEIDQIAQVIDSLKNNPGSRRHIVSAWNVAQIGSMALPPCHCFFQFFVSNGKLSCQMYARSQDWFLGTPFNIASYSLLTLMMAQELGLEPGEYIHSTGDTHLYDNHMEQVELQLSRETKSLPQVRLNPEIKSVFDFKYEDIELINYQHHPTIKAPVAV